MNVFPVLVSTLPTYALAVLAKISHSACSTTSINGPPNSATALMRQKRC